jgi:hypothetical protein
MANVEEARYRVLFTKDGKALVEARYAVRNNQRNFLKVTLPPGATLWSASLGGLPVRPGSGPDASLLLPLSKARSGEDAPEFAIELVYFTPGTAWTDKGHLKLSLPALDLPVSRTGLQVFYPLLFRLTSEAGIFHSENYTNPLSAVLTAVVAEPPIDSVVPASSSAEYFRRSGAPETVKEINGLPVVGRNVAALPSSVDEELVNKFHASEKGSRAAGILPVRINFPALGPSVYLVAELTSENQSPSAELNYQQDKKAGGK